MATRKLVLKVVVIGDSGVGKTSLMEQYVNKLHATHYKATIGADFYTKTLFVDDRLVTLEMWDTAGQERFNSLDSAFWRGADACILVFDVTSAKSFENLDQRRESFIQNSRLSPEEIKTFPFLLVGNKIDLEEHRVITIDQAKQWCCGVEPSMPYVEASAKEAVHVDQAFRLIAAEAAKRTVEAMTTGLENSLQELSDDVQLREENESSYGSLGNNISFSKKNLKTENVAARTPGTLRVIGGEDTDMIPKAAPIGGENPACGC
jgi:Ras-related protein Rab-7A